MLCFVFRCRSAVQFCVFVNFSNVLQVFVMYLNLRVYLFIFPRLRFSPFVCCYCLYAQFLLLLLCFDLCSMFIDWFTKVYLCSILIPVVELLFSFLYLSILVMFFKCSLCILICECTCLFLSVCFLLLRSY